MALEVDTRWDSTLAMLKDYILMHRALILFDGTQPGKIKPLTPEKYNLVLQVTGVLWPWGEISTMLQGSKYPTMSLLLPSLRVLRRTLGLNSAVVVPVAPGAGNGYQLVREQDLLQPARDLRGALRADLQDCIGRHVLEADAKLCTAAALLDPRFKDGRRLDISGNDFNEAKEMLLDIIVGVVKTQTNRKLMKEDDGVPMQPERRVGHLDALNMMDMFAEPAPAAAPPAAGVGECSRDQARAELESYLSTAPVANDVQVLRWWAEKSSAFPHVGLAARAVLAVPATSAQVERLFSKGGLAVTRLRSRLLPERAGSLIQSHMYSIEVGERPAWENDNDVDLFGDA